MAVLESRLVIAASDETAAAFAAVAGRIRELQTQLSGINTTIGNVGRVAETVAPAAGSVAPAARAVAAASPRAAPEKAVETKAPAVGAIETLMGVAAVLTGVSAVKGGYEEAAAQNHEKVRQTLAGMTEAQIMEGQAYAFDMAKKYPSVPQSEIMHLLRTGSTVTGDFEEAKGLIEPLTRLRVIAQAARPHASVEETTEEMDKLVKAMEIAGVTSDPEKFHHYIGGISKSLNAFGDQMKPSDYFEMLKYSRQAGNKLSERFLMTTMSTLGSEIGGASIGTAVGSFNRAMVGGHMEHQAAVEMADLGLFKESDLIRLKTGEVKGVKRGAHVQDWRMAQSDPDMWIQSVLLPALAKKGITNSDEVAAEISKLYPNRTAGQFVSEVSTQSAKLAKNAENWRRALSDEAADVISKTDVGTALSGMGNRIKNFVSGSIPTDVIGGLARGAGSVFSFLTPAPQDHNIMQDLKTDVQGWKDVFQSIHIGGAPMGEKWNAPSAKDSGQVLKAQWNARYFDPEMAADSARERSRGTAMSSLSEHGSMPQEVKVDSTVHGDATVKVDVTVNASSELISIIQGAKQVSAQMPLNPVATGHSGRMDSDAAPIGHGGIGAR